MSTENSLKSSFLKRIEIKPRRLGHHRLQSEVEELKHELDKWKNISEQKDENLKSLSDTLSKLQMKSDTQSRQFKSNMLEIDMNNSLQKEYEQLQLESNKKITDLEAKNKFLGFQLESLTKVIDSHSNMITNYKNKINQLEKENTLITDNFNILKDNYNNLTELLKMTEEQKIEIKRDLDLKNNLFEQLNKEHIFLQEQIQQKIKTTNETSIADNNTTQQIPQQKSESIPEVSTHTELSRRELRLNKRRR